MLRLIMLYTNKLVLNARIYTISLITSRTSTDKNPHVWHAYLKWRYAAKNKQFTCILVNEMVLIVISLHVVQERIFFGRTVVQIEVDHIVSHISYKRVKINT